MTKQTFGFLRVAMAKDIQSPPAQFAHNFGQPVEIGCILHDQPPHVRREQYNCDITYGTNAEYGFDYLRDNGMASRLEEQVQRGHFYAIVDEVDSILIDEARTPLIISGPVEHSDQAFDELRPLVERVVRAQQQLVNQKLDEATKLLADPEKQDEAGTVLLQVQRAAPKNKRFTKLISEQPGLKKLITRIELEYLRDKRMHELDENLLYAIDEKARNVDLLDKGRALNRVAVRAAAGELPPERAQAELDRIQQEMKALVDGMRQVAAQEARLVG